MHDRHLSLGPLRQRARPRRLRRLGRAVVTVAVALVRADALDQLTAQGWEALFAHGTGTIARPAYDRRARAAEPLPAGLEEYHVPLFEDADFAELVGVETMEDLYRRCSTVVRRAFAEAVDGGRRRPAGGDRRPLLGRARTAPGSSSRSFCALAGVVGRRHRRGLRGERRPRQASRRRMDRDRLRAGRAARRRAPERRARRERCSPPSGSSRSGSAASRATSIGAGWTRPLSRPCGAGCWRPLAAVVTVTARRAGRAAGG